MHVSLAVFCLVLLTGLFFKEGFCLQAVFLAGATFVAYNFIRWHKYQKGMLRDEVSVWFIKHRKLLLFLNVLTVLVLLYLFFQIRIVAFVVALPFFLATLFYMMPLPFVKNRYLSVRQLPGFKIYSIAVSWGGMVVLFPLVSVSHPIGASELLFFVHQVLFVFVLTLPFDIRDVNFDAATLKTLPQKIGVKNTKVLGVFVLCVLAIAAFLFFSRQQFYQLVVGGGLLLPFLLKASQNQSRYFSSFWVESIPVFWLLLSVILFK